MAEGWRQVWDDIRRAVRPRGRAEDEERNEASASAAAEVRASPLSPESGEADPRTETRQGAASPSDQAEMEALAPSPPPSPARVVRLVPGALAILLLGGLSVYFLLPDPVGMTGRRPPAPNVVATYRGGRITIEDVRRHLAELVPDRNARRTFQEAQDYQLLVEEMISDELVRRWAAGRNADTDKNFQHVMKHIMEDINLDELHAQMHQGQMGVTEGDVQAYYVANRRLFGDRTLNQVRAQIRATLQQQRESRFAREYLTRLKETATVTRDFALLAPSEPEERELQVYFEANRAQFVRPAQAMVDEIRVDAGPDEAAAREKAARALTRLRSGEDFAAVARDLSGAPAQARTVRKGERGPAYDAAVFALDPGQISEVIRAGDAFYVVRLRTRQPERQQRLDEVREQVLRAVMAQQEQRWFAENGGRTLFTIRGRRYTLGEFWKEYQELPEAFLARYQGLAGRKALAERLIERLLLLQDSYDRLLDATNKQQVEEARLSVLAQMLEQEEVDEKIKVSDEEVSAYYQAHKKELTEPPQVRIRYIVVRLGQPGPDRVRAWAKANEAYRQLVPGVLQKGRDFADVARRYSEDQATAARGGELDGWIREGPDLLAELAEHPLHEQTLALRTGEISRPFAWGGAIYIVQVVERKEARPLTLEEVKEPLREELRQKKHDELAAQLSGRLLREARVVIYDQTLRQLAREASPAVQP